MVALCDNKSHFHATVHLHEWWLVWGENEKHEKRLAVSGYTSRGRRALRIFSSSPILRRHDVFTLETTDGTYVGINGLINKTRTEKNGFPFEVFKCFFFGFPPHWEVCAEHYLAQGFGSNDILREDASLKGCRNASEQTDEMTKARANFSLANTNPELNQHHTACIDMDMENKLKENKVIKKESIAEEKTYNNVSTEDASLEGCSTASKHINEMANAQAEVSLGDSDLELDQKHTICMIVESSKNSNEAVRITRARGAKDTYQRKTVAVEKESILEENTASKEASTAGKKTCTDASRRFKESPKKSDKAVRYHTRSGGARNTDNKRIANVKKGGSVTPKADVITSVISPGLSIVKRSRSGRLLLPTLEYWRNQMAVYDLDHKVIGIKDGISTPSRAEMTHEPKRAAGRPRSKNDPDAAMDNSTHKPKRAVGRPRSKKDLDAAVEIKGIRRR